MAFDFATLTGAKSTPGSIKFWVNHDTIDAAGILDAAQAWVYEQLRTREMRTLATLDLDEGAYYADLPASGVGFLSPIELRWRGDDCEVAYVHENLLRRYVNDANANSRPSLPILGHPDRYAIFAERFQFEVAADEDLTGDLLYYATPAALSVSNTTNFLTRRFPLVLRRTCMALGYEERKRQSDADDQYVLAKDAIDKANAADDMGRMGQMLR